MLSTVKMSRILASTYPCHLACKPFAWSWSGRLSAIKWDLSVSLKSPLPTRSHKNTPVYTIPKGHQSMWKLLPNVAVVCPEENWYPPTVIGHRRYNVQQDTSAFLVVIYFPRWTKLTQTLIKPAMVLLAIFLEPIFCVCVCVHFVPSSLCYFHWAALHADPAQKTQIRLHRCQEFQEGILGRMICVHFVFRNERQGMGQMFISSKIWGASQTLRVVPHLKCQWF